VTVSYLTVVILIHVAQEPNNVKSLVINASSSNMISMLLFLLRSCSVLLIQLPTYYYFKQVLCFIATISV
jgi:hypothetical protein